MSLDAFKTIKKTVLAARFRCKANFHGIINWAGEFICGVSVSSLYTWEG